MHLDALLRQLVIIFFAGVLSVVGLRRVGLPPIVGFLVAGVLIGPHTLGLIDDLHTVEVIAELGVALLLFTIGLEFSLQRLRPIARLVAVGGALQVGLTVAAGGLGALALGQTPAVGVTWGLIAALSSTAIVLQSLTDRGEINAPHGKLVVGVLIFQDLAIVPMMLALPMLGGAGGSAGAFVETIVQAALVVAGGLAAASRVVPALLGGVARANSREVFILAALCLAAAVAWATSAIGLSIALGAFLAGVIIAETEFAHTIAAQVGPFRDALASVFFISIGMLLDPRVLLEAPLLVGGLVLLLVVGKLGLAALAVLLMRFPVRVALLTGASLAQIGEFSFVLLRAAQEQELVDPKSASAFIAASVMTMIATPLIVARSPSIAAGARLLAPIERLLGVRAEADAPEAAPAEALHGHVVIGGLGHGGRTLAKALHQAGVPFVAVDLDPARVAAARAEGWLARYADLTSVEALEHAAHVSAARRVVLMLSDPGACGRVAAQLRALHPQLPLMVRVSRLGRDAAQIGVPDVQVIAEDEAAAADILVAVLREAGLGGEVLAQAAADARHAGVAGGASVGGTGLMTGFSTRVLTVEPDDWAAGLSLRAVDLRRRTGALVIAAAGLDEVRGSPDPDAPLDPGTLLVVAGKAPELEAAAAVLREGPASPIAPAAPGESSPAVTGAAAALPRATSTSPLRLGDLSLGILAPLATTGGLALIHAMTGVPALALYGAVVMGVAVARGRAAAAVAGLMSFALGNMTLVEPLGELTMESRLLPLAATCALPVLIGPMFRAHLRRR
jgi:CPA2 family monovalent cation:H+ antiporter-2